MASGEAFQRLTGIDPERDGKRTSAMVIPVRRGPPIRLPVTVVRNGEGPTVLFTGGNHGDEFEGPVAIAKMARALLPGELAGGRVILMPAINPAALAAGTRTSPLDGKNLNRAFPGRADGTPTERIAHAITTAVLPLADALYDLHAGGRNGLMIPSIMGHVFRDPVRTAATLAAMKSFRAPAAILIKEYETAGMIDTTAERLGLIFGCCELGGAGVLTPETVAVTETGMRNVLKHAGILKGRLETAAWQGARRPRLLEALSYRHYTKASAAGILEPFVELAATVRAGQPLGQIHALDGGRAPVVQRARVDGVVYMRHGFGRIEKRQWVAIVAHESRR